MSDQDVVKGQGKQVAGRVQNAVGNVTGDVGQQIKGAAKQAEGKVQEAWGKTKDDARTEKARLEAEHAAAKRDETVTTTTLP
jgi:uncharacterized protein YjbJ (UPF0337 family)